MNDRFHPLGAQRLAAWIARELDDCNSVFGIPKELWFEPSAANRFSVDIRGTRVETPIGVAAGPHTQLAQNIIVAWLCGARVIELKTVQTLDRIEVSKPCIDMQDAGYNIEWSQELSVPESFNEYLTAWVLIHVLHSQLAFPTSRPGVLFDLSVGYDLNGIHRPNMQWFLDHVANAGDQLEQCVREVSRSFPAVVDLDLPTRLADSVTLSTLHGCPPGEIEAIAEYLLDSRGLHTSVKLNPTLVGYDKVREILIDHLGWNEVEPHRPAFEADIGYADAVGLLRRLQEFGRERGLDFGVKLCNTLPVVNRRPDFDRNETTAYLSGRPLHALAVELAYLLTQEFNGDVALSFAGGADAFSTPALLASGLKPVTICSDLLRPGGYLRLGQYLEEIDAALDLHGADSLEALTLKVSGVSGPVSEAASRNLERYADALRLDPEFMRSSYRRDRTKTRRQLDFFDCIKAPCTDACSIGQRVPSYMRGVAAGKIDEAAAVIRQDNPLPSILGRACHHPCEPVCLRIHLDQPVAIREIKRFVTDHAKPATTSKPAPPRTLEVAVVGAGPCGLATAADLAREGVQVVLFEAREEAGGMVSATIPGYRASPVVVRRDLEAITALGPKIEFGVRVGRDFTLEQLFNRGFDYVVIASGAQRGLRLGLADEDVDGVFDGLDFLRSVRNGSPDRVGRRISVVGGGDVAMDCARSARRLTTGDVEILYRRTTDQMPAHPEEIRDLLAEGITIRELMAPRRIIATDGRIEAIECARMMLSEEDGSGRPSPVEISGSRIIIDTDTLVVAIGQQADLEVFSDFPVTCSSGGYVEVNLETLETSIPKVYVGGDLRDPGPSNIVDACGDGRRIARAILSRERIAATASYSPTAPPVDIPDLLRRRAHRESRVEIPRVEAAGRGEFDEVVATLDEDAAAAEAGRCLDCDVLCSTCDGVCPNRAIATYFLAQREESSLRHFAPEQYPQVAVMADFCNECGNCATFCPTAGRPWSDKPRIYFDRTAFEAETDNAFMLLRINGNPAIQGRFRGLTRQLALELSTPKKDPCHPERSDLRGRVVEGSPGGWNTAPVGSSNQPSGDSSTLSRTRSLRMTGTGGSVIPGLDVASRLGGAQGDIRGGDSETSYNGSDTESAIMSTLLRGLTASMPHLPMPEAEPEWLVTPD